WGETVASEPASEFNLLQYWRTILKHRFVVLGIFAAAVALGVATTLLMTPIYTASTTIQIDREAAKVVDVEGVTPIDAGRGEEFFQTQYGLLKSRSLAARVVDDLGLAKDGKFLEAMGSQDVPASNPNAADIRRKRAIGLVMSNLSVRPVRGSRLVNVSFDSP